MEQEQKAFLSRGQQNKKGFFSQAIRKELLTLSAQADIFMRKQIWTISFTACKYWMTWKAKQYFHRHLPSSSWPADVNSPLSFSLLYISLGVPITFFYLFISLFRVIWRLSTVSICHVFFLNISSKLILTLQLYWGLLRWQCIDVAENGLLVQSQAIPS